PAGYTTRYGAAANYLYRPRGGGTAALAAEYARRKPDLFFSQGQRRHYTAFRCVTEWRGDSAAYGPRFPDPRAIQHRPYGAMDSISRRQQCIRAGTCNGPYLPDHAAVR